MSSKTTKLKVYYLIVVCFFFPIVYSQQAATVILPGNYPDPSIVCANNGYYLINSTGYDNPGIPIWYSSDLKEWKRVAYGLNQRVGDVWAPDLVFYNGLWYIYFTALIEKGIGNFVITAQKPEGPWSKPVKLDVSGIDPGHVVTPDGKRYIYMNGGELAQLDATGTKVIEKQQHVFDGWPIPENYTIECFCLEGPKALYCNGYYYLVAAQGGTSGPSTSHMAIAARSKNIDGPWELSPYNPIIHTKDKSERWWSTGHGTIFKGLDSRWYMVYHSYENGYRTHGRQVLISPMEWTADGWFREASSTSLSDVTGKAFTDGFDKASPDLHWTFWNDSASARVKLINGKLLLKAKGEKSSESTPLLMTAENLKYQIITKVTVSDSATACLVLYYNDNAHWGISLSKQGISEINKGRNSRPEKFTGLTAYLKVVNDRDEISFFYSSDEVRWNKIESSYDISGFTTNTLSNFRSIRPGIITYGKGTAQFEYFKYEPLK